MNRCNFFAELRRRKGCHCLRDCWMASDVDRQYWLIKAMFVLHI